MYHTNVSLADGTLNNITNGPVWIRISALTTSDSTGNRESFAIDNVSLTFTNGTGGCSRARVLSSPASITVYSNATAKFTVGSAGTGPVLFQWLKDGNALSDGGNISGSATFQLSVASATAADQGNYICIVSNVCGSTLNVDTSHSAALTVIYPPAVSIGYLRTLVTPNTYFVTNSTLLYQVTGLITTATNLTSGNTASYYLQDGTGGINLFVTGGSSFRPNIGDELTAVGFLAWFGGNMEIEADIRTAAQGGNTATYVNNLSNNIAAYPQAKVVAWDFLGFAPTNANLNYNFMGSVVLLTNVYFGANAGVQTSQLGTNRFTNVTNSAGKLTQIAVFTGQDEDLTNRPLPAFAYSVQGVLIGFTTNKSGVVPIINGNYEVGITRWSEINTTTPAAPLITGLVNQSNFVTTTASFSPAVAGYAPLTYQWSFGGSPLSDDTHISGSSTASLSISNVSSADVGLYTLLVSNWVGVTSGSASLIVGQPAPVSSISASQSGTNLLVSYSGGLALQFVLVGTNDVTAPAGTWPVVAITNGTSPGTFTVPMGPGDLQFFRMRSQ